MPWLVGQCDGAIVKSNHHFSSAILSNSKGLYIRLYTLRECSIIRSIIFNTHSFRSPSTEERMTGKVIARCLRAEQNARKVLRALKIWSFSFNKDIWVI
jgi:hypothetical protein